MIAPWWTRVQLFTRDSDGQQLLLVGSLRATLRLVLS
jgi:hypothetical protein